MRSYNKDVEVRKESGEADEKNEKVSLVEGNEEKVQENSARKKGNVVNKKGFNGISRFEE